MTRRARIARLAVPAVALVLAAGCDQVARELETAANEVVREFGEDASFAWGLGEAFDADSVSVRRGEGRLMVVFASSETARLPDPARRAAARRVAEYVRDHYVGYGELASVSVAWFAGPFEHRDYVPPPGSYTFSRAELGEAPPRPAGADTVPPPTWRDLFPMEP